MMSCVKCTRMVCVRMCARTCILEQLLEHHDCRILDSLLHIPQERDSLATINESVVVC
eukprot:m.136201 g.136201  ORF g.136201 m.136201 type:complete len:58 (-) comp13133_c2_seq1:1267-1440(-)